jgi:hypothetical protein
MSKPERVSGLNDVIAGEAKQSYELESRKGDERCFRTFFLPTLPLFPFGPFACD